MPVRLYSPSPAVVSSPAPSLYYLLNFERALAWVGERYEDLLDTAERAFLSAFPRLPEAARALLVRMLMRRGSLFRASRLVYEEIGCPLAAAAPLAALGWVDADCAVTIDELFAVATLPELSRIFPAALGQKQARKAAWLEAIRSDHPAPRRYGEWAPDSADRVIRTAIDPLCERLRLMFFGNLHQDWSEFVLADLGVYQYETVPFPHSARAFRARADIEVYLALHACRAALDTLDEASDLAALLAETSALDIDNPWLETRCAKLLYRIGNRAERLAHWRLAHDAYLRSSWPGARHRRIRVLERDGQCAAAHELALHALCAPESEAEAQRVERMMPRLRKAAGEPGSGAGKAARNAPAIERETLVLPYPAQPFAVEYVARDHLGSEAAPVFYVENGLINSLFGLLCWEAVFAPVPGAFFHPFQRGPADLHAPDFQARRAEIFDRCLTQLDSEAYRSTILHHYEHKNGLQSPFVFWAMLTPELMSLALDCLPAAHLKVWFSRLLADIRENRSGLPDLVRFWRGQKRYELIEIKGPGDKLQDNQTRWLRYCVAHGMPVRVIDIRWASDDREQVAA
ncbi:VRR-NUC domain-containing protein [Trinickia diaoshuihuensis]|uniref:VRR-NUC domain-containing protein n=1 Tax=Trinickia diaoshuihuensis TaxID=2292265 RepID=UPI000E25F893|nr:VRR-NUC domain-containing protein [Trinickia diaoshuihuensis]